MYRSLFRRVSLPRSVKAKVLWKCCLSTVFWVLWLERNTRNLEEEVKTIWDRVWSSVAAKLGNFRVFILHLN